MKRRLGILILILLACLALPLCSAQALNAAQINAFLGERADTDVDYRTMNTNGIKTVSQALDWLDSYMDIGSGYALQAATDLAELVAVVEQDGDSHTVINSQDKAVALQLLQRASDLNAEAQFYYDKLYRAAIQIDGNLDEIRSGLLGAAEQNAYMDDIATIIDDTKELLKEAIDYIVSNDPAVSWAARADSLADALNASGFNAMTIANIRTTGFQAIQKQAEALENRELAAQGVNDGSKPPRIKVISDKQVGFSIGLSDPFASRENIPIWVRPYDVKNKKTGTWYRALTDDSGAVVYPVADFLPDKDGNICVEVVYNAAETSVTIDDNGFIVGDKSFNPKYQRREMGRMYMKGGDNCHMVLPDMDGKPYVIRSTFNGLDMRSVDNGMWGSKGNDATHSIEIKLFTAGEPRVVAVGNLAGGKTIEHSVVRGTFAANADKTQVYTGRYCYAGASDAFLPDQPIFFQIVQNPTRSGAAVGGDPFGDLEKFLFKIFKPAQERDAKWDQEPCGIASTWGFRLPQDWPIIGGSQVRIPVEGPVDMMFEYGKMLKVTFNYNPPEETPDPNTEDTKAQDKRIADSQNKNAAATKNSQKGIANLYSSAKEKTFIGVAKTSITPYLYILLEYKEQTEYYEGSSNMGVVMGFRYEFTKQFMVGPAPAFIGAKIDLKLYIGVAFGARFQDKEGKPVNWDFSGNTGINANVHVELGLTVGAGLPRIAFVALRGTGWLDIGLVIGRVKTISYKLGLKAEVTVQILWWSKSWEFWRYAYAYPEASLAQSYLLSAALNGGQPQTTTLSQANARPGNYAQNVSVVNAGRGEVVTETTIIADMPAIGTDVKYAHLKLGDDPNAGYANYALWIGMADVEIEGETHTRSRIFYKNLDDNSPVKMLPYQCRAYVEKMRAITQFDYVLEFDFDYVSNEIAVCYTSNNEGIKELTDRPYYYRVYDMEQAALHTNMFMMIYHADASGDLYLWKQEDLYYNSDKHEEKAGPTCVPRVRYTRELKDDGERQLFYGGVRPIYREYKSLYIISTTKFSGYGSTVAGSFYSRLELDSMSYQLPDFQIFDFASEIYQSYTDSPAMIVLAQKVDDGYFKATTKLVIGCQANHFEYAVDVDFNQMIPIRERYKDDRYQFSGVMLLRSSPNDEIQKGLGSNSASICYFPSDRKRYIPGWELKEFTQKIVIRDMGVKVSADGLNAVSVSDSGRNQLYAYWMQGVTDEPVPGQNDYTEKYQIMASLIDTTLKACTPSYVWATLQEKAAKITLLPLDNLTQPMIGFYMHAEVDDTINAQEKLKAGLQKISFQLTANADMLTFAPDVPVVNPGKPFGMYFRFENTGSLILRGAKVSINAVKVGTTDNPVVIKDVVIRFDNPEKSQVTQYDFPDANGNPSVLAGKHSVYPVFDVMDVYAGNHVTCTDIQPFAEGGVRESNEEVTLQGMMPGTVATYKTNVVNSPTSWLGDYELYAQVDEYLFTLGMGDNDPMYAATRNADDSFTVTPAGTSGATRAFAQNRAGETLYSYRAKPVTLANPGAHQSVTNLPDASDSEKYVEYRGAQSNDRVYADMNYNNLRIKADVVLLDGKEYASVTLSNDAYHDAGLRGAGVTPMLNVLIDGKVIKQVKLVTELDSGFSRVMLIPIDELTGGKPYAELKLLVTSGNASIGMIESGDQAAHAKLYNEIDLYGNGAVITPVHDFTVTGPADVTVYVGKTATFSVTARGGSRAFTYQWHVTLPNGTTHPIAQATSSSYAMPNVPLSKDGLRYWCEVSDGRTIIRTSPARLTVLKKQPLTGDASAPGLWLALCALGAMGGAAAVLALRARRKRGA